MSQNCPLCGNIKNENSIFCDNCKSKIENEYEVSVYETHKEKNINISNLKASNIKDTLVEVKPLNHKKTNSTIKLLSIITSSIIIIVSLFYLYKTIVINNNLEKAKWDEATKENTISGYLSYMVEFPKGKNYNLAEESLMRLKKSESDQWDILQKTDNSTELLTFINHFPNSAYIPLIRKRLDSLTWCATLKDNTNESYRKYIDLSSNGEFEGYYLLHATERHKLLTQSYPSERHELDSIQKTIDGFFVALSTIDATSLKQYLASNIYQFFNMGSGTREKIVGDLVISGSKTQSPTISFIPDLTGVTYEKTLIQHYKAHIPLYKSYTNSEGHVSSIYGFIINVELDSNFRIITINEKSPIH